MAKIKDITFKRESLTGERIEFLSAVSVDGQGEFSLIIPNYLEESAQAMINAGNHHVELTRPRQNLRVSGSNLQQCIKFIDAVITDYLKCDTTRELVILYTRRIDLSYVKALDGSIHPNGQGVVKYQWCGDEMANRRPFDKKYDDFAIGIAAEVKQKITYTRASGVKIVYEDAERPNFADELWLDKLNSFVGVRVDTQHATEMPYTEEAAKFFYEVMLSMCKLADRIDSFFGSPEAIQKAITNQIPLLGKS